MSFIKNGFGHTRFKSNRLVKFEIGENIARGPCAKKKVLYVSQFFFFLIKSTKKTTNSL